MKLRPPVIAEHHVRRRRVLALLDEVMRTSLTLVIAPAGTGKTSLVAGWAADAPIPVSWLSLDEQDRDRSMFWSGMIAALEVLAPGCGERAALMLRRSGDRVDAVDQLLVDLEAPDRSPAALVVDNLHTVDDQEPIAGSLAHFVQNAPAWLRMVLISRREPPLPVDRMRSRGQLAEIRFAELRFSSDEAAQLLAQLAPELSEARIAEEVASSDGWAASLQMAALTARSGRAGVMVMPPDQGDRLMVQDYVIREVLADESPEVVETLSAAAIVTRINPGLAGALTGRADAGKLLRTAADRGLFMTRLGQSGWYELHSLVREVLRSDLAARNPERLTELHARAAQWFEEAGEIVIALEHWLLADRARYALQLLSASHARLYDSGREDTVKRTLAAIPPAVATADLEAMVEYAWCHLLVDRRRFVELVDQLAWWVERSSPSAATRFAARLLQAAAAVVSGRWVERGALHRQAAAEFGDSWWLHPLAQFVPVGTAREIALTESWHDDADEVRQVESATGRFPDRQPSFNGVRALGLALAGHPADALRVAAGIRRVADVSNMTILRTELAVAEALAHRELGDRSRALAELRAIIEASPDTMVFYRVLAMCQLAEIHLDEGDLEAAATLFDAAEQLADAESMGSDVRAWLARVGTLIGLRRGDIEGARRFAEQAHDTFWGPVSRARVEISTGDLPAALDALDAALPRCVRHEVVLELLRARVVGDREGAFKHASTAVEVAAEHSLLQTVASEGHDAIELVERAAVRAPDDWLERLRRLHVDAGDRGSSDAAPIEPLTERERDVLRFLPSRLTVREIADELYVSVNTVKFHLRVIYRKLGVSSRAEAAKVARHLTNVRR